MSDGNNESPREGEKPVWPSLQILEHAKKVLRFYEEEKAKRVQAEREETERMAKRDEAIRARADRAKGREDRKNDERGADDQANK